MTKLSLRLIALLVGLWPAVSGAIVIDDFSAGPFSYIAYTGQPSSIAFSQGPEDFQGGGTPPIDSHRVLSNLAATNNAAGALVTYEVDTTTGVFRTASVPFAGRTVGPGLYFTIAYGSTDAPLGLNLLEGGADRFRLHLSEASGACFQIEVDAISDGSKRGLTSHFLAPPDYLLPENTVLEVPFSAITNNSSYLQNVVAIRLQSSRQLLDTTLSLFETAALPITGDLNRDSLVNIADYEAWSSSYGGVRRLVDTSGLMTSPITSSIRGITADANNDGQISAADYTVWRDAFDAQQAALATPEPSMVTLVAIGAGLMAFRRRTRG